MLKQKTRRPVENELTGELTDRIRVYTIAREVDGTTPLFEKAIKNLKREFDFDQEVETFNTDIL